MLQAIGPLLQAVVEYFPLRLVCVVPGMFPRFTAVVVGPRTADFPLPISLLRMTSSLPSSKRNLRNRGATALSPKATNRTSRKENHIPRPNLVVVAASC